MFPGACGCAEPAFVFYPPLAYYAVAPAPTVPGDLVEAILIAATLLSALALHWATRRLTGDAAVELRFGVGLRAP